MLAQWLRNVRVGVSDSFSLFLMVPKWAARISVTRIIFQVGSRRKGGKAERKMPRKMQAKTYHVTMGNCVESLPALGDYGTKFNSYASLCSLLNLRMIAYPTFKKISK